MSLATSLDALRRRASSLESENRRLKTLLDIATERAERAKQEADEARKEMQEARRLRLVEASRLGSVSKHRDRLLEQVAELTRKGVWWRWQMFRQIGRKLTNEMEAGYVADAK